MIGHALFTVIISHTSLILSKIPKLVKLKIDVFICLISTQLGMGAVLIKKIGLNKHYFVKYTAS